MKIVTDFSVASRPLRVGAPFNPTSLFGEGDNGSYHCPEGVGQVFADTDGQMPAAFGQSVARIEDRGPNGQHALQASAALRPLLGRAPVAGRRNLFLSSEDFGHGSWGKILSVISPADPIGGYPMWRMETAITGGWSNNFVGRTQQGFDLAAGTYTWTAVQTPNEFGLIVMAVTAVSPSAVGGSSGSKAAIFNTGTGTFTATGLGAGATYDAESLGEGVWKITVSFQVTASGGTIFLQRAVEHPANEAESPGRFVFLGRTQLEQGATATPYQDVGSTGLDVTEAGFPSPAFIRFDLSDDVLSTEFPDGFTGDVMVFGRQGSWIERDVTIAAPGALEIGPTTITGGPAGLLAALGDIVGWLAIDRTLTAAETSRLERYHSARGAGAILESL